MTKQPKHELDGRWPCFQFRERSESVIRSLSAGSDCLIVGRAAAIVIGKIPTSLHVRLDGRRDLRILQAAKALNISADESARRMLETDRARSLYVKHFYSSDWGDAALYHLVLDSTEITLATCADIIVAAAADRFAVPGGRTLVRLEGTSPV
jgi:cytidylate kinase